MPQFVPVVATVTALLYSDDRTKTTGVTMKVQRIITSTCAIALTAAALTAPAAAASKYSSCEDMWKTYPNGVQKLYFGAKIAEQVVEDGYLRPKGMSPDEFKKMPSGKKFWTKSWFRNPSAFLCGRKATPPATPANVVIRKLNDDIRADWEMTFQLADQPGGGIPDVYGIIRAVRKETARYSKPVNGVRTYTITFKDKYFKGGDVYFACAETAKGSACADRANLP